MTQERHRFEPLGKHHNRAAFASGDEALDQYFRQQVGQEQRRRVVAVYVLYDVAENTVIGYYTLSATGVQLEGLPAETARKLPRYPIVPAILFGRLAVDARYQGQGFGALLLIDALRRCHAVNQIGAVAVVVDAKGDAARRFYERYGFRPFAEDAYRLFLPMATIAQLVPTSRPADAPEPGAPTS